MPPISAAQLVGAHLAALDVVGRDEAHDLVGGEGRVHDHGRRPRAASPPRPAGRAPSRRGGEDDPVDALARERLDDLHLLLAVVLAQRPLPEDLDGDALRGEVALGLDRTGVDRAPELVGRALGDEGDAEGLAGAALRPLGLAAGGEEGEAGERGGRGRPVGSAPVRPSRPGRWPRSSGPGSPGQDRLVRDVGRARGLDADAGSARVGVLRVRMQSSQFERCALVPSASERTRISGSGVWRQGWPLRESSL